MRDSKDLRGKGRRCRPDGPFPELCGASTINMSSLRDFRESACSNRLALHWQRRNFTHGPKLKGQINQLRKLSQRGGLDHLNLSHLLYWQGKKKPEAKGKSRK